MLQAVNLADKTYRDITVYDGFFYFLFFYFLFLTLILIIMENPFFLLSFFFW